MCLYTIRQVPFSVLVRVALTIVCIKLFSSSLVCPKDVIPVHIYTGPFSQFRAGACTVCRSSDLLKC